MDKNSSEKKDRNKIIEKGRLKGTSAFNIQQTQEVDEISWSNNKFESTCHKRDDE